MSVAHCHAAITIAQVWESEREKKRKFLENWREKRSEDVGRTDVRREEQLERGNKESG